MLSREDVYRKLDTLYAALDLLQSYLVGTDWVAREAAYGVSLYAERVTDGVCTPERFRDSIPELVDRVLYDIWKVENNVSW